MNMIHIIDAGIASHLNFLGFQCREQNISKQKVFTFIESPELLKTLNENFSKQDFFVSQTMNF